MVDIYKANPQDSVNLSELALYHKITSYRTASDLPEIPLSKGLNTTAGRHVVDTYYNFMVPDRAYEPGANLHSWSDAPYYSNHSAAANMWDAPERLGTGYTGSGFEISAAGYADVTAALTGWQGSAGHNDVILNNGGWGGLEWKSIGLGVLTGDEGKVYHVWFGAEPDATGVPDIRGTKGDNTFTGTNFRDRLFGLAGADRIDGARGNDRIEAGAGRDTISGGAGADDFVFVSVAQARGDRITDFISGSDDIILSAFMDGGRFIGAKALSGRADEVRYDKATGLLQGDKNGDGRVDWSLTIANKVTLTSGDFVF